MIRVTFSCAPHLEGVLAPPTPALRQAPAFFKALPAQSDAHPASGTVKRCVPFLEALSAGFILPLWADLYVKAERGEFRMDFPEGFVQEVTLAEHSYAQLAGHPRAGDPYGQLALKFINPWLVSTEPGISCLFTAPLNHLESRFKLLDGIVDTDRYYNPVNLPFLWTGGDGEFFIPRGTPLVQVIPFHRAPAKMALGVIDTDARDKVVARLGTRLRNAYREMFWHKGREAREAGRDDSAAAADDWEEPGYVTEEQCQGVLPDRDAS